ncbi:hypothetical protein B9R42_04880 [Arthrospira platensis PCC 7345]
MVVDLGVGEATISIYSQLGSENQYINHLYFHAIKSASNFTNKNVPSLQKLYSNSTHCGSNLYINPVMLRMQRMKKKLAGLEL